MTKNVLITGASRGIGRAIALSFASAGYHLYLTCKHQFHLLKELKKEIEALFPVSCHIFQCDCSNPSSVSELFTSLPDLDVLINNAGISYVGLLTEMSLEDWDHVIGTNLNSLFYTCRLAVPSMINRHQGKIINISSVWGDCGASMEVAYSASKGGINSFTKALAKELAPSNIQVNAIACGLIDTEMNSSFSSEEIQLIIDEIPADRIGTPEEVAKLCLQLCESPSYLTGQIIKIDGGWC